MRAGVGNGTNVVSKLYFTSGLFKMSLARLLWARADAAPSRFTGLKTGVYNGNTAV